MINKKNLEKNSFNTEYFKQGIFEEIEKDLNKIKENLTEWRISIPNAQDELKKINERLETQSGMTEFYSKELSKRLKRNIEEISLKNKVSEVVEIIENFTIQHLASLKYSIQHKKTNSTNSSYERQQEGRESASINFDKTTDDASNDRNILASLAGKAIKRLSS